MGGSGPLISLGHVRIRRPIESGIYGKSPHGDANLVVDDFLATESNAPVPRKRLAPKKSCLNIGE
ncbi:hypothetical protein ACH5RR_016302, partial [Cinchona calisaya]